MVEARFVCTHKGDLIKNDVTGIEGRTVNFIADVEDPVFKVFTPSGQIRMQIVGEAAYQFEVGRLYKVTFDEIPMTPDPPGRDPIPGNPEDPQEA
jgi:hypothetical protein